MVYLPASVQRYSRVTVTGVSVTSELRCTCSRPWAWLALVALRLDPGTRGHRKGAI